MIDAILRGKLTTTEDVLTSCVVGLLAESPREHGLLAWLERARPYAALAAPLRFGPDATFQVVYWPQTTEHGEPDVLVEVLDGRRTHAILIEAKYGAPKSDWVDLEDGDQRRDQLARYWSALRRGDLACMGVERLGRCEQTVIYVTAHGSPPMSELSGSIEAARDPSLRLAWLSWRDAWSVAAAGMHAGRAAFAGRSLCALLEHLGLTQFRGVADRILPLVTSKCWFFEHGGFEACARPEVRAQSGWHYGERGSHE